MVILLASYSYLLSAAAIVAATSDSKSLAAFSIPSPTSKRAKVITLAFTEQGIVQQFCYHP